MSAYDDKPASYEAALAAGFRPIKDLKKFLAEKVGITVEQLEETKHTLVAPAGLCNCATTPGGCLCLDYCSPNGVRILQYCGPHGICNGHQVYGKCPPYGG